MNPHLDADSGSVFVNGLHLGRVVDDFREPYLRVQVCPAMLTAEDLHGLAALLEVRASIAAWGVQGSTDVDRDTQQ